MRRNFFWVILGGVTLLSAIILAELVASIIYLRSPEHVITGAFGKIIDAKSFSFSVQADDPNDNLGATLTGSIDKKQPTSPTGQAAFTFVQGNRYSLKGELTTGNGQAFLKLDDASGLPPEFANALSSIWTNAPVSSLYLVAEENALSLSSYLSDADLGVIFSALKNDPLFRVAGKGDDELLDNVYVVRYPVVFDKKAAGGFLTALQGLLKNQNISADKFAAAASAVSNEADFGGEVWIAKSDGTLRAASFPIPVGGNAYVNLKITISDYNKKVSVETPEKYSPLSDILKQIYAPTLGAGSGGNAPAPVIPGIMPLINPPAVPLENNSASTLNFSTNTGTGGDLIDALLRFFYGTNPFGGGNGNQSTNVFNVNTQK